MLGPDTVVIHAVTADAEDVALFAELDVPVVHCPRSNALLGCGIAPVTALRDAGVRVGLGTDSPASALTLDMWDEMRAAILLARAGSGAAGRAVRRRRAADGDRATVPRRSACAQGLGTLPPGRRPISTVVDLSGSPSRCRGTTPSRRSSTVARPRGWRSRWSSGGYASGRSAPPPICPLRSAVRARMIVDLTRT